IDGVDQTDVLLGNSATGHRESLLSFIRWRLGGGALEAMAHLFHRHPSDRRWAAAATRPFLDERANGGLSKGIQYRDGPTRGPHRRGNLYLGVGTGAQSRRGIFGVSKKISEPAGAEYYTIP